jgi:hypothetical protein
LRRSEVSPLFDLKRTMSVLEQTFREQSEGKGQTSSAAAPTPAEIVEKTIEAMVEHANPGVSGKELHSEGWARPICHFDDREKSFFYKALSPG